MKVLRFIRVSCAQLFYDWAMREINPLHRDLPRVLMRQRELRDEAERLWR
jgi:hypothetical protein